VVRRPGYRRPVDLSSRLLTQVKGQHAQSNHAKGTMKVRRRNEVYVQADQDPGPRESLMSTLRVSGRYRTAQSP
jgi:hypothetical protein